ncbi:MAG: acyl-CoA dehydrogenase family protein, partial [Alphaproteobacteria bacterium]
MQYSTTEAQQELRAQILKLCADFGDDYWLKIDQEARFPEEFYRAVAAGGWLGTAMPEEFGGDGLGISEATARMQDVAESGACMSGASAIHMNIFGLNPVVVFGSPAQKQRFLPPLIQGHEKACFGVTEPNTGLNTTELKTRAEKRGDRYVINGQKIWISTAQVADRILLLARTTPLDQVKRKTDGLTLFYIALDRAKVEVRLIHKMGRHGVDSNMLFFDGLEVPEEDRIGAEG